MMRRKRKTDGAVFTRTAKPFGLFNAIRRDVTGRHCSRGRLVSDTRPRPSLRPGAPAAYEKLIFPDEREKPQWGR